MSPARRTALIAGVFFALTFVSSIAAVALYAPLLTDPRYVLGAGADTRIFAGAFCEIVLAITNIGTAVVLYPIVRRQSEGVALGYVASRIAESVLIAVGILSVLSVVTLRQAFTAGAGADAAAYTVAARSLVALHDWTFLLGPGLLAGLGNGLLLGSLLYRSRLIPRGLSIIGVIGGPLVFVSGIAVLFGLHEQASVTSAVATIPEFVWEAVLSVWLIVRGFRPDALERLELRSRGEQAVASPVAGPLAAR